MSINCTSANTGTPLVLRSTRMVAAVLPDAQPSDSAASCLQNLSEHASVESVAVWEAVARRVG
jgi:hypothetical protein